MALSNEQHILDDLSQIEGSGTQLVSLYVPADKDLQSVIGRLRSEHAEADNIKSKKTREHVKTAISSVLQRLQSLPHDVDAGIVVFAGVDADGEKHVEELLDVPVSSFRYHCDSSFLTDPLRDALDDSESYGLIVVERRAGTIGLLHGDTITHIRDVESDAKGKHSAGGFSAERFDRLEEEATAKHYANVADAAETAFRDVEIEGVLVGGTNISTDQFLDHLPTSLVDDVLGTFPVEYHGEEGLRELVRRADETITVAGQQTARRALDTFFTSLRTEDPVVYGVDAVDRAAEMGAIDTLLIGQDRVRDDEIADITDTVEEMGGDVVTVGDDFEQGSRFNDVFGGIGAICRYDTGEISESFK